MSSERDCVFCQIVRKEIHAHEVLRDRYVVAFHDSNPQAPVHLLIVPIHHASHLSQFAEEASPAARAHLFSAAATLGKKYQRNGFRIVINEGPDGGQTVHHLHLHLLAGRHMTWPPG
ncbi:MAG: HIT domain-containing protein [Candidatus Eremiobacteraeota bacterium]|nr:HIT domain-containing protein [Candidatus Eremiobacteraeota bacterium]MBV8355362.1 HIT domain-containing protein [Candidatus Eremiobacteraeota bacterium]